MRRFLLTVVAVAITVGFAFSETHTYKVTEIKKDGESFILTCKEEGTFNKDEKKMEWKEVNKKVTVPASQPVTQGFGGFGGGAGGGFGGKGGGKGGLEGGFGNKQFETIPEGGLQVTITTADADVKKGDVTTISVAGQGKGKGKGKAKDDGK